MPPSWASFPPLLPAPVPLSFLPSSPLRRPRPVYVLPPHVTRQRAMQITAAASSHWPRRAHLMAARARRMAAGPRAVPAPCAPPLPAHGPGQAAGSRYRARPPGFPGPLCAPALPRLPPAPLPSCTVIAPLGPLRSPLGASLPLHPRHLGPAHVQRTRRASLLEVAAPELEAAEDGVEEKGGSAQRRPARRQRAPDWAPRIALIPKSGAATWPRLHLFVPLYRGRPGCSGGEDGDPGHHSLRQVVCARGKLSTCKPDRR